MGVGGLHRTPDDDGLMDRIEGWHASISAWPDGHLGVRISLTAGSMIDASQSLTLVSDVSGARPVALDLTAGREFCQREGESTTRFE